MKLRQHIASYAVLVILVGMIFGASSLFPGIQQFAHPEYTRQVILSYGEFARLAYLILIISAVPLPIPSTPVTFVGGYLFGTAVGALLAMVGVAIGSSIAFFMVRRAGKPLLRRVVDMRQLEHLSVIFKNHRATMVLLLYAIPIFPSDMLSFFLGFTRMNYRMFLLLLIVGHIPRLLIINALGSSLHTGLGGTNSMLLVAALVFMLIAVFRNPLRRVLFKELRMMKRQVNTIGKSVESQLTQLSTLFGERNH